MQYRQGSFWNSIPLVTKNLLIINVLMWVATIVFNKTGMIDLTRWLGLHFWQGSDFNVVQMFTYMFMHDSQGFAHIFFNMFSLWMFGSLIERSLGTRRYLFYYLSCGLGAALCQELTWQLTWQNTLLGSIQGGAGLNAAEVVAEIQAGHAAFTLDDFYNSLITVGASGAIFGILLAFGMMFPNMKMFIIPFPFPIKAKWMVLGYGLVELFFGVSNIMNNVAHFAHLGGMLVGIFIILYWKHKGIIRHNGYY